MPSEKFRTSKHNLGPVEFLNPLEFKDHISGLGLDRLSSLLWIRAEGDDVLRKALVVATGIHQANGEWEKVKYAIDYALHFPDYVSYTVTGHGQILEEIKLSLKLLVCQNKCEFALRIGQYALECGQSAAENFEDDWDWTSSLNDLEKWLREINKFNNRKTSQPNGND